MFFSQATDYFPALEPSRQHYHHRLHNQWLYEDYR